MTDHKPRNIGEIDKEKAQRWERDGGLWQTFHSDGTLCLDLSTNLLNDMGYKSKARPVSANGDIVTWLGWDHGMADGKPVSVPTVPGTNITMEEIEGSLWMMFTNPIIHNAGIRPHHSCDGVMWLLVNRRGMLERGVEANIPSALKAIYDANDASQ